MTDIVEQARQYVRSTDSDHDPETQRHSASLLVQSLLTEIERLRVARETQAKEIDRLCAMALEDKTEIERLRMLLWRLRAYISAEHTLDRPKEATLEMIDAVLRQQKEPK